VRILDLSPDLRNVLASSKAGARVNGPQDLVLPTSGAPPTGTTSAAASSRSGGERRLTRNSADGHPSWSPDGSRIAFSRRGTVWIMRPDGSGQRKTAVSASDPIWAPDSRHFAFSSSAPASLGGGVWIVGLDGRNSRRVASAEQIAGFSWGPGPVAR